MITSSIRSRPYFVRTTRPFVLKSQPTCECQNPRSDPRRPAPLPTCGECGSPSTSECAWCLRWSETHWQTGPCDVIEPSTASSVLNARLVSKLRCVK